MRLSGLAFAAVCCGLAAGPAVAEEWSPAQTEVLKSIEAYWAMDAAGDLDSVLSSVHDSYVGWDVNEPMTSDKTRLRKFLSYNYQNWKTAFHDIQPVAINVIDNVAIAHYHFTAVTTDAEGKKEYLTGRWSDIFMKQGNKWLLIGDHGGTTSDE